MVVVLGKDGIKKTKGKKFEESKSGGRGGTEVTGEKVCFEVQKKFANITAGAEAVKQHGYC